MKLVSLNTWCGRRFDSLADFVRKHQDADFFCFQEVGEGESELIWSSGGERMHLLSDLSEMLPDHNAYFAPFLDGYDAELNRTEYKWPFGLAMFVRKTVDHEPAADFFVYGTFNSIGGTDKTTIPRNVQFVRAMVNGNPLTVCNFHGLWYQSSKGDNEHRIEQSRRIKEFLDPEPAETIVAGDFNLLPDTKSLAMLEEGMKNLIKDFSITDTRGPLYTKDLRFADYTLVSPGVQVKHFDVPKVEVSDHLPMILEFDL